MIKLYGIKHRHTNVCLSNWWNLNEVDGLYQCQFSGCVIVPDMQDATIGETG